jgi:hypothetical protein
MAAPEAPLNPNLLELLRSMVERGASDLHLTAGSPPSMRVDDQLRPLSRCAVLTPADTQRLCYQILTEEQRARFERAQELDLSFGVKNLARFRANLFMQRGAVAAAIRAIPFRILSAEELGLPPVLAEVSARPRGGRPVVLSPPFGALLSQGAAHNARSSPPRGTPPPSALCRTISPDDAFATPARALALVPRILSALVRRRAKSTRRAGLRALGACE